MRAAGSDHNFTGRKHVVLLLLSLLLTTFRFITYKNVPLFGSCEQFGCEPVTILLISTVQKMAGRKWEELGGEASGWTWGHDNHLGLE